MSIHEGLFLLDPAARWQVTGCGSQGRVCSERDLWKGGTALAPPVTLLGLLWLELRV